MDPASIPNTWGDFGTIQIALFNNYAWTTIGQYTITNDAINQWYHVKIPLPAGVGSWGGPMLLFQDWDGSPSNPNGWHLNNPSAVTYYIDNLKFVAKPPAPAISVQPVNQEIFTGGSVNWQVLTTAARP